MKKFKVGERVQFKTWEEMEKEFGVNVVGNIRTFYPFSYYMKHLCGTLITIERIDGKEIYLKDFTAKGDASFYYSLDMIKHIESIKSFYNDKVVVYNKNNKNYVAKCSKEDKFDLEKGLAFAMLKSFGVNYQEFKEMLESLEDKTKNKLSKLSHAERVILENLPKEYNWIARDYSGSIFIFTKKPTKKYNYWTDYMTYKEYPDKDVFNFIKWENEEPYEVSKLLGE